MLSGASPDRKETIMKASEAMSREVRFARPDETICDAARTMAAIHVGALPVRDNDRLLGMITDRDIAVRAVALKKGPDTKIRDVMTKDLGRRSDVQTARHRGRSDHGPVRSGRAPFADGARITLALGIWRGLR